MALGILAVSGWTGTGEAFIRLLLLGSNRKSDAEDQPSCRLRQVFNRSERAFPGSFSRRTFRTSASAWHSAPLFAAQPKCAAIFRAAGAVAVLDSRTNKLEHRAR
jgi:hypothetical protein